MKPLFESLIKAKGGLKKLKGVKKKSPTAFNSLDSIVYNSIRDMLLEVMEESTLDDLLVKLDDSLSDAYKIALKKKSVACWLPEPVMKAAVVNTIVFNSPYDSAKTIEQNFKIWANAYASDNEFHMQRIAAHPDMYFIWKITPEKEYFWNGIDNAMSDTRSVGPDALKDIDLYKDFIKAHKDADIEDEIEQFCKGKTRIMSPAAASK